MAAKLWQFYNIILLVKDNIVHIYALMTASPALPNLVPSYTFGLQAQRWEYIILWWHPTQAPHLSEALLIQFRTLAIGTNIVTVRGSTSNSNSFLLYISDSDSGEDDDSFGLVPKIIVSLVAAVFAILTFLMFYLRNRRIKRVDSARRTKKRIADP